MVGDSKGQKNEKNNNDTAINGEDNHANNYIEDEQVILEKIPENSLVKFFQCKCGAWLEEGTEVCWSCGRKFTKNKNKKRNKNEGKVDSNMDKGENHDTLQENPDKLGIISFITCPVCGAQNEDYGGFNVCWNCGAILTKDSKEDKKEKHKKGQKKHGEAKKGAPIKKIKQKYVLHCERCNSWFVSNTYDKSRLCDVCKSKGTLAVSYFCAKCNKYFDLKDLGHPKCPHCGEILTLTKESMLY
ncbi:MAG: hypothetical protein ACTSU2_10010 [Promethearchaeota archaeon]